MHRGWWLSFLVCAAAAPATAQQVSPEPTVTRRCLVVLDGSPGIPEYPFSELRRGETGSVKVDLSFPSAGRPPAVSVLASEGSTAFVESVRAHVAQMRVPCMEPTEAPARLTVEFVFKPDESKVVASEQASPEEQRRSTMMACLQHTSGTLNPEYPHAALRAAIAGRVVAQLRFTDPGQPPEAQVHARPQARLLKQATERMVEGYRLPCLTGAPVSATLTFVYKFEGDSEYGIRNLTLTHLLGAIKDIRQQQLNLDTTRMSCPFDMKVHYLRPALDNRIEQLGSHNPARHPLVEFLRTAELRLSENAADAAFADHFTVSVPCLKIDLKPKE